MYDIKGTSNGEFVFDESDYDVPLLNIERSDLCHIVLSENHRIISCMLG